MRVNNKMILRELVRFEKIVDKMNMKYPKGYPNNLDTETGLGLRIIASLNNLTDILCTDKARVITHVEMCEKTIEVKNKIIRDYEEETKFRPRRETT